MDTHSQTVEKEIAETEKPYVFKKYDATKDEQGNITKPHYFKVHDRVTGEVLEGFEVEEFNSPLVGHRYINGVLKAIDAQIEQKTEKIKVQAPMQNVPIPASEPVTRNEGFEIPIIGEEPVIEIIGGTRYFELVVHEQDSDAKRKDVYLTDGVSRDFHIMYDVPVILPAGCLNVLREAIYTQHECIDDVQNGKVLLIEKQVPRFSIQVNREVPQSEAEQWLKDKKKIFLQKV